MVTKTETLMIGTQNIDFTVEDVQQTYTIAENDLLLKYYAELKMVTIAPATVSHADKTLQSLRDIFLPAGVSVIYLFKPAV